MPMPRRETRSGHHRSGARCPVPAHATQRNASKRPARGRAGLEFDPPARNGGHVRPCTAAQPSLVCLVRGRAGRRAAFSRSWRPSPTPRNPPGARVYIWAGHSPPKATQTQTNQHDSWILIALHWPPHLLWRRPKGRRAHQHHHQTQQQRPHREGERLLKGLLAS